MELSLRRLAPALLFASVLVLLILVGVIQYQWFSRAAASELEGTVRTLETGVRQAVAREFQRYAPVVSDLQAWEGRSPTAAEAEALLDRLDTTYGTAGNSPGLLAWVGYRVPGASVYRLRGADGRWSTAPLPSLAEWTNPPPGTGFLTSKDNVLIYRPAAGSLELLAASDIPRFFTNYVFPSLTDLHPGAALSWAENTSDAPPPGGFDRRTYSFNPFSALVSGPSLPSVLEVGVPRFVDLPGRGGGDRGGPKFFTSWTITLRLPADAPVLGVEQRLAWNWLGGSLLLAVVAVAFGLTQYQAGRMADLRRREREFVASVSHELRTPLTVIRSAADNVAQGLVAPDRQKRYGDLILDQSVRLGRMIEEMLAFAQTEAGPTPQVRAELDFGAWVGEVRPPLETLAASRGIRLGWDSAGLPAKGTTDPESLRLIVENLVVNALNHAYPSSGEVPEGAAVRVTLRFLVPDRLEVTVDDDGRGISAAEARKVFEPFYRDQVSRAHQEKGSGLGLFLAQRRARRAGGELRLESPWRRPDGVRRPGCRFTAVLPCSVTEEVAHGR